ncbi:hypothetical protein CONPUDRAFT_34799, partial [Coniophora puteana RWD-64-598 SS2]
YGRMMQAHTGHCFSSEYYASFIHSETQSCPCSAQYQSHSHIIEHCPIHEHAQHHLHKPGKDITLTDVLSTKAGLEGFTKFLQKIKTFRK